MASWPDTTSSGTVWYPICGVPRIVIAADHIACYCKERDEGVNVNSDTKLKVHEFLPCT